MSDKWGIAADLLQEAIDTIRARGSLRDGETDLIDEAARVCGRTPDDVLDVMLAIKHVRFLRAGDWDSAVDFIAYKARAFANGAKIKPYDPVPYTPPTKDEQRAALIDALNALHSEDVDLRAGGSE